MKHLVHLYIILGMLIMYPVSETYAQNTEYKLIHMGNKAFRAQNYQDAGSYYMKVLKNNPNNTRATFNLADTYLAQKNPQAADSLYNVVTKIETNKQICSMAWHNRGYISQVSALHDPKQQQQLLRQAIEHYKQALRLNPRDNDTRYNLALCQKQLKDEENKQQQQQEDQKEKNEQQQEESKNEQKQEQKQPNKQDKQQMQQYMNLAKQAEKKALEKLNNQQPRQKSLDKNW